MACCGTVLRCGSVRNRNRHYAGFYSTVQLLPGKPQRDGISNPFRLLETSKDRADLQAHFSIATSLAISDPTVAGEKPGLLKDLGVQDMGFGLGVRGLRKTDP